MSLIYDYLKINGKSDSERVENVAIPPTLNRSDPARHHLRTGLVILGSCLAIGLVIFSVFKIFVPEKDVQLAVDSGPLPTAQIQPVTAEINQKPKTVALQQEKSIQAPSAEPIFPATPYFAESRDVIQVFPEVESPELADIPHSLSASSKLAVQPDPVRRKIPQTIELGRSVQKIRIPGDVPVSTMGKQPVQKLTRESSSVDNRFYSSARPESAKQIKSKKLYQAGLHAQQSGDQRVAEIYYIKALEEFPQHMEAMINLSALFVQQQRYVEAEDVLADILKVDPANSKALVNMGVINLYKFNEPLATELFLEALEINPAEENALVNLAYLAEKRMDYVAAEKYYRHLLRISPDNIEVLLAYGYLLEEGNRFSEAMDLYEDCLGLDNVKKDARLYDKIKKRIRILSAIQRER